MSVEHFANDVDRKKYADGRTYNEARKKWRLYRTEACIDIGDVKSGDSTMAETSKGKKFVKVKGYTRVVDGKKVRVGAFDRSTPKTSKGKRK